MLYAILGVYLALMLAVGLITMVKTKTIQDFFLGNRTVGPWISAFAYGTTYFSAVLFIGYAGSQGWSFGLPVMWVAAGNALLGCLLPWLILGRRTRSMTAHYGAMTMPEFLEARYGSKALKIAGALIIFIFLIPYSAAAYTGLSYLFEAIFNIKYIYALIGMAVLTGFYLILGGYFAVTLTDFIQGLIMLIGAVLMVGYVLNAPAIGGLSGLAAKLALANPELAKAVPAAWPKILWLVLLTSLGAWGMPQMVQKFYAIKHEGMILRAAVVGTVFCLVIAGAAYLVGSSSTLFSAAIIDGNPQISAAGATCPKAAGLSSGVAVEAAGARVLVQRAIDDGSYRTTMIIPQILHWVLPPLLLYVILVLVLSATMSTVSSLVLVSSSAITIDLLQGSLWPRMGKRTGMLLMRLLCLVFILLSVLLAWRGPSFLVALMSYSWGTIAGAFLGPYVLGLFWKRVSRPAVWAGMAAGVLISLFSFFGATYGDFGVTKADAPMYGSLAMLASLVVVAVVTLLSPHRRDDAVDRAFAAVGRH